MGLLFLVIVAVATAACGVSEPPYSFDGRVRVGVLPDRDPDELRGRYRPLIEYLAASTGLEFELVIPESYDELLEWFHQDRIQLAWFGGLTYLRAERRSGALALVMRDVDLKFTTDFLVASSRKELSLREFVGATLSFGPALSTSGHLMPRFHLYQEGIEPETFYRHVRHSDGHDQTVDWVQNGHVDLGAVNSVVVESMFREGRLSLDRVRVLQTTQPYRNYVWAVRPDVPAATRSALQNAFLALEESVPEHAVILDRQGAQGYVPASQDDYDQLRHAAKVLGL